jgi:hypothetical protein
LGTFDMDRSKGEELKLANSNRGLGNAINVHDLP